MTMPATLPAPVHFSAASISDTLVSPHPAERVRHKHDKDMVARLALNLDTNRTGPRPLNPMRDLGPVADLMEIAFADELDASGRQMIREARALSRTGPFLYPLSLFSGAAAGLGPGFVWDQEGKVVGNVTIVPSRKRPGVWHMANVAVHPDYRRQGIASALVRTAIEHVQAHQGSAIQLQVRDDGPAVPLYQRFGFTSLGTVTRWRAETLRYANRVQVGNATVRGERRADWRAIWNLFTMAPVAAQGWPDPLTRDDFRPSTLRRVGHWLASITTKRWVAPAAEGDGFDGYVELRTEPRSSTRLTLRVHPRASGWLEGDLLRVALRHQAEHGAPPVIIDHPADDQPAEERFREAGMNSTRTLQTMQLIIPRP
jgi:ribosomal protein S18 acetylase RimI-like enzyme